MPRRTSQTGSELFIVDNSAEDWKVLRYLRDWCGLSKSIDIATGYFEIGSLLALDGEWQKVDKIRILMGDEVSKRTKKAFEQCLANVTRRLDNSLEAEKLTNDFLEGVPAIVEAIHNKRIECRVYRKDKFHAKCYITHARQEVVGSFGLVGSSNFTHPGITQNLELNVQITGSPVAVLQEWYEEHWSLAEDVTPERKKTALILHAKDDLPEVRVKVDDLLRTFRSQLRFRAVVCDKQVICQRETKLREQSTGYRVQPDNLHDELAQSLFSRISRMADAYLLRIAKRGNKDRNKAIRTALEKAESEFETRFGVSRGGIDAWEVEITDPQRIICLQAADYFLWAPPRFYEPRVHQQTAEVTRESHYLDAMWPQVSQVHDLHFDSDHGTFFNRTNPLTLDTRFGSKVTKRKKPQV